MNEKDTQDANAIHYEERRYAVPATAEYHRALTRRLIELISPARRAGRVLDCGCGTGFFGLAWDDARARGFGVDLSRNMLRYARGRIARLAQADARALPFRDDAFDAVLARDFLHHLPNPAPVVAELWRVLRAGGELVAIDPHATPPSQFARRIVQREDRFSPDHRAFTRREYVAALSDGFSIRELIPFGYLAFPAVGLPDIVDFARFLPSPERTGRALAAIDEALERVPLVNRFSWKLIVKAVKSDA
ncbi:MAG: class I SAM-dependent methyltransferase [Myxococcota bacterium]